MAGVDDADMELAARTLTDAGAAFAWSEGRILPWWNFPWRAHVPGCLGDLERSLARLGQAYAAVSASAGDRQRHPFMAMSFLSLA